MSNHIPKAGDKSKFEKCKTIYIGGPHLRKIKYYYRDIQIKETETRRQNKTNFHERNKLDCSSESMSYIRRIHLQIQIRVSLAAQFSSKVFLQYF